MTRTTYTKSHRDERDRWRPIIAAGRGWCAEVICLEPTRWIEPGTPWDLAHDTTRPGCYHGPSHARCNRSEGAIRGNQERAAKKNRRWTL